MSEGSSPISRSIGVIGVLRWLLAVAAVIAVGAAFAAGYYLLAIVALLFVVAAVVLGLVAWQARRNADPP
jgi:cation transporter-like permease